MNIQGHAALVTGGGSGLGEATARELARQGAKVAVLDLNLENAQRVAKDIGGLAVQCNVTDEASMQTAIEQAAAAHGPARILMQIAGIGSAKRVVGKDGNAAPLADFARVINVNLIGTYNAARLFANYVLSQEGNKVFNADPGLYSVYDLAGLPKQYVSPKPDATARKDLVLRLLGLQ